MRMKQKTKSIVTALLLGVLCAVTLSAVITVPDWETARADLLIGMQYETTGLDLDAVPGWLAALVMLHQNFPLDGWAWGPAAAGLAVLLCWVRGQREAKPKRTELVLSIVFGIAEVLWCCTIKVDIENSKSQYIEKDKQEATKDGSESTKIQHGI